MWQKAYARPDVYSALERAAHAGGAGLTASQSLFVEATLADYRRNGNGMGRSEDPDPSTPLPARPPCVASSSLVSSGGRKIPATSPT
jgi:hypothetical protein